VGKIVQLYVRNLELLFIVSVDLMGKIMQRYIRNLELFVIVSIDLWLK